MEQLVVNCAYENSLPMDCQIKVVSLMGGSVIQYRRRNKATELRIIDGPKERMASSGKRS